MLPPISARPSRESRIQKQTSLNKHQKSNVRARLSIGQLNTQKAPPARDAADTTQRCRHDDAVCHGCGGRDANVTMQIVRHTEASEQVPLWYITLAGATAESRHCSDSDACWRDGFGNVGPKAAEEQ